MRLKKVILASALASTLPFSSMAEELKLGVSVAYFNHNYLTLVRQAMQQQIQEMDGVSAHFEDAKGDVAQQVQHIENFVDQGVDAIITIPVDTQAVQPLVKRAQEAGIPLVFVVNKPESELPANTAFVGSDSRLAGLMQMEYIAEKMGGEGNIVILLGVLSNEATRERTKGVEEVVAKYPGIRILDKQTGNFYRNEGVDITSNWLLSGLDIDAVVSNNDEMAIGAIMALQQSGKKDVIVGGIDATPDALAFMDKGLLDVTVFQDAAGQGRESVTTAVKLARGESVEQSIMIPYQLITPENVETLELGKQ
ncbi:rhizopine-binding protein [Zobellella endophytica]|uniref:Rhizopine-binding protein n=1 Tax=Zobellella endophytica TaxID=2116700 RepID=A0A2P7R5Y7_9GAMM|nr:sugar ABC transporter substrate-binding protein [Zobellella endophytica]PSJ45636.1 rhizopine-binding protein [Zobellella endophytica]